MIRPPGFGGALFGTAAEGDARADETARAVFIAAGAPEEWAFVSQVHGNHVVEATRPGRLGEGDAIVATEPGLAVTVAAADCVPIVVEGTGFAAVIHAGWRGAASGVVRATLGFIARRGLTAERAALGPSIGPCCYEVGEEVLDRFPDNAAKTSWGTPSVDLRAIVTDQLDGIPVWVSDRCTMTDPKLLSYRRDRTPRRQVAVAWLPPG